MSMMRRKAMWNIVNLCKSVSVAILLPLMVACGAGTPPSEQRANVTETSDGVTFVRAWGKLNDAVAHKGVFVLGSDQCLYVKVEGVTYLAAVDEQTNVSQSGVAGHPFGAEASFGRLATKDDIPPQSASQCLLATELFGVGF